MTETVVTAGLIAIGTLGVAVLFGDQVRALFGSCDNALGSVENTTPATRPAEGTRHRNLANFTGNASLASGGNKPDRVAMKQALRNALKSGVPRHLASRMPPSAFDPKAMHKTGLGAAQASPKVAAMAAALTALLGAGAATQPVLAGAGAGGGTLSLGGATAGAGELTALGAAAEPVLIAGAIVGAWHLVQEFNQMADDAGVAFYRSLGWNLPTREERLAAAIQQSVIGPSGNQAGPFDGFKDARPTILKGPNTDTPGATSSTTFLPAGRDERGPAATAYPLPEPGDWARPPAFPAADRSGLQDLVMRDELADGLDDADDEEPMPVYVQRLLGQQNQALTEDFFGHVERVKEELEIFLPAIRSDPTAPEGLLDSMRELYAQLAEREWRTQVERTDKAIATYQRILDKLTGDPERAREKALSPLYAMLEYSNGIMKFNADWFPEASRDNLKQLADEFNRKRGDLREVLTRVKEAYQRLHGA